MPFKHELIREEPLSTLIEDHPTQAVSRIRHKEICHERGALARLETCVGERENFALDPINQTGYGT